MARTVTEHDGVASKMAKYVPAEMVTIATAYFAAFDPSPALTWAVLALGAVLNVLYLYSVSKSDKNSSDPSPRFFWLSAIAFVLWSAATIDEVASQMGLDTAGQRAFVLSAGAFVLPLLDSAPMPRRPARRRAADTPEEWDAAGVQ